MKINIAEPDYRAIDRESFSSIKHLLKSPREYIRQKETPFEGNAATRLGTAIHMFLQGEGDKVQLIPTFKTILKDGSEGKYNDAKQQQEWIKANKGIIGTDEQGMEICHTIYNLAHNLGVLDLLKQYEFETAHLFERGGIKFKGRLDGEAPGKILDIKTTQKDIVDYKIARSVIKDSNYDMQLAMYQYASIYNPDQVVSMPSCSIVAVCTTYPYAIKVYNLSTDTLAEGYRKWDICIKKLNNLDKLLERFDEDTI